MSRRALLLALALDALGEPPPRWHPVVWMGNYLSWARRGWRARTSAGQLREGAVSWGLGAGMAGMAGLLAARGPWWVQGAALKPLLARKALFDAVAEVRAALVRDDLREARRLLAWHLVSRDTSQLSASEVAGAAIESLAENLSDSVVAPLLAFRVGGLPLASTYRLCNTADAMWGYRTPELEWTGKTAARADDLLNLAPARLTALCTLVASGGRGLGVWVRDRGRTSSPNAGHPMSAFAGVLDVQLDKRGVYVLNPGGREPTAGDVRHALGLARTTLFVAVVVLLLPGPRTVGSRSRA
ncbi:adenosylcobinamide-phosphate synthase CbiB [Deinococcus deserti]|uniref:Cobalamin biosynthesis protein CobD n=1 Tax=Deinococcus deserti (strain DSM 17065 / CIP 109153 / LMG 22923 / VCD115) TaxID=546414 RepID=C1D352_DEIDV|nr:adenosylcobinamide-phosphate synthase CbiB [Deinococcus deserti]ACO47841.1 putative cobalamin biosynthesis protein CobD [Deinococcus deserti VCD115]